MYPRSLNRLVTGERRICYIGGINTVFGGHEDNTRHLSRIGGDIPIYTTYNGTHGMRNDLRESKMGLNLIATPPVTLSYKNKLDFFQNSGSDKPLLVVNFSQGSIHDTLSQLMLPEEYRKRCILVSIAPAVFSPQELWKKAFYYCAKNDPLPKLQKVVGKIPAASENITYVETGSRMDVGHRFTHEAYVDYLEMHINDYIKGEYD